MAPDRHPCACEACDEWALGENSYCIMCTHHGCRRGKPKCPAMENSPKWCDSCQEKKETTYIHGKHLCNQCLRYEDAKHSDYEDLFCVWCNESVDFPFVLDDFTVVEKPTDLSLKKVKELETVYHPDCAEEHNTLKRREESNRAIEDFT